MAAAGRRPGAVEAEIGLSRHVSTTPALGGRLKVRVDDFQVDEVGEAPKPDPAGRFVAARVRLTNWETNAFVREASQRLGVSRQKIHYSGAKDKRGVTEQWFSFEAPADAVKALEGPGVQVLDTVRTKRELALGDHAGNRFRLVLRAIDRPADDVRRIAQETHAQLVAAGGAPNVFGPQRFGAQRATTHLVGERIVRGDFLGAVRTYLDAPTALPDVDLPHWRGLLDARDWKAALAFIGGDVPFERALLHRLAETDDPIQALLSLNPYLQRLFVHALQSWLFNQAADRRVGEGLGLAQPQVGDLAAPVAGGVLDEVWVPVAPANVARVGDELRRGRAAITGLLPGTEAPFAEGPMGRIERQVLADAKLERRDFLVPERLDWSSKGTRRALAVPLEGFACDVGPDELHPSLVQAEFRFTLPAGAYATSVLREFMKSPRLDDYA